MTVLTLVMKESAEDTFSPSNVLAVFPNVGSAMYASKYFVTRFEESMEVVKVTRDGLVSVKDMAFENDKKLREIEAFIISVVDDGATVKESVVGLEETLGDALREMEILAETSVTPLALYSYEVPRRTELYGRVSLVHIMQGQKKDG